MHGAKLKIKDKNWVCLYCLVDVYSWFTTCVIGAVVQSKRERLRLLKPEEAGSMIQYLFTSQLGVTFQNISSILV
jgi:hypothetical protein